MNYEEKIKQVALFNEWAEFEGFDTTMCGEYEHKNRETHYAFLGWMASLKKFEGCVVVPINNTTIVAIEKMVEQQVEASGITADVFRLDGEKILNAAVEAARGGK